MNYKTIHTTYGLRRQAAAEAAGVALNLTHMAIGDGGGVDVEPDPEQTQLVRECYRAPVNRIYQAAPDSPNFIAELLIPAAVGGFVMREVAVFDADGGMVVVGNLPATVKPVAADGAFSDSGVRVEFVALNASVITLQIDPNVALATHAWVTNNITAAALVPGGTTGQVLRKKSNEDGDTEWTDLDAVNVVVDCIEEKQQLVDGQVQVVLSECTTRGLVVYVDGQRLPDDAWTKHPTDVTRFSFVTPVAGAHELIAAQNEPTGDAPAPLERSRNLSDLASAATARANLGVLSADETRQMAPPGAVVHFARTTAPAGWLKCNGAAVSRTAYAALFAAIGTTFGAGDGFNTFNVPDTRGEFIRSWDDGRGVDAGRSIGSAQSDATRSHVHNASSVNAGAHAHTATAANAGEHAHSAQVENSGTHSHTASTGPAGGHYHGSGLGVDYGTHANALHGIIGGFADKIGLSSGVIDYNNFELRTSEDGNHSHNVSVNDAGYHSHTATIEKAGKHSHTLKVEAAEAHSHTITVSPSGGTETRPRNVSMLACIKF